MAGKVLHHGVEIPVMPEPKDPDSTTLYGLDYELWLQEGEQVSLSVWFVHPDLTIVDSDNDTASTSILISGGKRKRTYRITNRITTTSGRIEDRSFKIVVRDK